MEQSWYEERTKGLFISPRLLGLRYILKIAGRGVFYTEHNITTFHFKWNRINLPCFPRLRNCSNTHTHTHKMRHTKSQKLGSGTDRIYRRLRKKQHVMWTGRHTHTSKLIYGIKSTSQRFYKQSFQCLSLCKSDFYLSEHLCESVKPPVSL